MGKDLKIFESAEFGKLTVIEKDGKQWFIGKEVATILGYSDTDQAIRKHCKLSELFKPVDLTGLECGPRGMVLIPEPDIYRLAVRSKLPSAERFELWVFDEVLPAIRKTGGYMVDVPDETPEEIMARALIMAQDTLRRRDERLKQLETKIELDAPKVEFADTVMEAETDIPIGMVAKFIGIGRNKFFEILRNEGILAKSGRTKNVANQPYIDRGYFTVTEKPIEINETVILKFVTLVTPKGQDWLIKKFKYIEE